jgi:small basic protein (TIGR04137 family)
MSVDKSLKVHSALTRPRCVLSRTERMAQLRDEGRWEEERSVFGLPKVRVRRVKRKAKPKAEAPKEAAPGTEAAAAATPAPTPGKK